MMSSMRGITLVVSGAYVKERISPYSVHWLPEALHVLLLIATASYLLYTSFANVLLIPTSHQNAITVRFLTQRYIGEYSSRTDLMYRHSLPLDDVITELEILDTCKCSVSRCLYDHIRWGEAFVVVYSITDEDSFLEASKLLQTLDNLKLPSYYTTLLLGNKRDLDHARVVCVDDGHELSLRHGCLFYEVSAAGSTAGIRLAFQSLLRQTSSANLLRNLPARRKIGVNSVSKVLGNIFGKKNNRKRPSLSI